MASTTAIDTEKTARVDTPSVNKLISTYPRERLFVHPLLWTQRHLSLLCCEFVDMGFPPPPPPVAQPNPTEPQEQATPHATLPSPSTSVTADKSGDAGPASSTSVTTEKNGDDGPSPSTSVTADKNGDGGRVARVAAAELEIQRYLAYLNSDVMMARRFVACGNSFSQHVALLRILPELEHCG